MAWTWCIASKDTAPAVPDQADQVRVLVDAYGLDAHGRGELVDAILERQSRNARFWAEWVPGPCEVQPDEDVIVARIEWSRREYAFVSVHRATFERALT